ncbi:MAG: DUF5688 family protein, partial [Lachnospiraceae bacterium]|nr:DUF5688 family protein [Lachnospiraceae bacterium]
MTYQEFKEQIYSSVAARCNQSAQVHISTFKKNNGITLDGLVITDEQNPITPTLYLNDYYPMVTKGLSIDEITERILSVYYQAKNTPTFDPDILSDFSAIKDKIIFKLVNKKSNLDILRDVPYMDYLDLAIIFAIVLPIGEELGTILIHNNFLEDWSLSKEDLFEYAKINTYQLFRPEMTPIESLLSDMISFEDQELFGDLKPAYPMFVLSNQKRINGAGVICYPDLLKNFSETLNCDFYILPSSIHEVIVIPMDPSMDIDELTEMVQQVNHTQVA